MSKSGLTFDAAKFRKLMEQKKRRISASSFRPQFREFVSRSLTRAAANCPVRDLALIQEAQAKQYENRVNYIPSIHDDTADPRLIVTGDGTAMLFCGGKWYHDAANRKLPDSAWNAFQSLNQERERRLETPKGAFIANRAQARFLYVHQFLLIARSLGVRIAAIAGAAASHSRRQPPKAPARPNARWQGGKEVLSAVITAPFLSAPTAYWEGRGMEVLKAASDAERPRFVKEMQNEIIRRLSK